MKKLTFAPVALFTLLTLSQATGCKDDPPPPPPPAATGDASAKSVTERLTKPKRPPKLSPLTMKRFRVETCFFGAYGLRKARDGYAASLEGAEPSPEKMPAFGQYAELKKRQQAAQSRMPNRGLRHFMLPFLRYVRACGVATKLVEPKLPELDAALKKFSDYVTPLTKAIGDTNRYYGRKEFEKDDGAKGKKLHTILSEGFPKLDDELTAFDAVVNKWLTGLEAPKEKMDEAGKAAQEALLEAENLTLLFLTEKADSAAIGSALTALQKSQAALETIGEDKKVPHPRVMRKPLKDFILAVEGSKEGGKIDVEALYSIVTSMASIVEANQRGLSQLLVRRANPNGKPMRLLKPGIGGKIPRINARPFGSVKVK